MLDGAAGAAGRIGQGGNLHEGEVGQRVELEVGPEVLHGIELRGIGREGKGMEAGMSGEEGSGEERAVSVQAIPQQDDGALEVPLQVLEERDDAKAVDIAIGMETEGEAHPVPGWRNAQGGDGRHLLMAPRALQQDGRGVAGPPAAPHNRSHEKARLVKEDEPGFQSRGFFLIRGQVFFTHPRIFSSSRSTARRWGRCGLQPRVRRSRPI